MIYKILKTTALDDCSSNTLLISITVADGNMESQGHCLVTPLIVIMVDNGTPCAHVMCVRFNPHVGGNTINYLFSIIFWLVYYCWCDNMVIRRVRQTLISQGSN